MVGFKAYDGDKMNDKGFALVTALLLGSVSMLLVITGAYMVSTGTLTSGIQKRYQSEVEKAAGTAELVMSQLILGSLTCTDAQSTCSVNTADTTVDPTACSAAAQIYFSPEVCTALDKPNCINLSGCYLSSDVDPADTNKTLVSIKIVSRSDGNETAIIDVVYKLE